MTACDKLRQMLRSRDDHHKRCASRSNGACDCYASGDTAAHVLIDEIETINGHAKDTLTMCLDHFDHCTESEHYECDQIAGVIAKLGN